jgi:uncharacterized membrane protein
MSYALVTNASIISFSVTISLIVPLFIIAVLVDASRNARRVGPVSTSRESDRVSIRQSRRTLLAMAIGITIETMSLVTVLTGPKSDSEPVIAINFSAVIFQDFGLLVRNWIGDAGICSVVLR